MNNAPLQPVTPQRPPAQDLYIFHIQGCVSSETMIEGDDFIGNWEEDGYTFLFFSRPGRKKVSNLLKFQPHLTLLDNYHMTYEQWLGGIGTADTIPRANDKIMGVRWHLAHILPEITLK